MDVEVPEDTVNSKFTIQRDSLTEEWIVRFREDAAARGAIEGIGEMAVPRTLDNIARFALKRPLIRKPF
ncbi:hypothetical protein [Mesorhizobium sp. M7A.F.Ca.US.006.01.1.1]|uniref:hypothetical protein n=1 Tax=Mesorhizobium sp. M7A.F.Ca.US.006.01.1.1 TaxID=2496707 RepID=UPI001FDFE5FC|nr:hypothetical protein [Mesorhizobium sp. M7A.F.Ca.US.006.01.1.1]